MKALKVKLPRVSERQEQAAIVKLLRSLGGQVYIIGTTRRAGDFQGTMQTPGIPDLLAFLPPPKCDACGFNDYREVRLLFIECKAAGGRMRPEQTAFQEWCRAAGVKHLAGDADAVLAWVTEAGYLR